MAVVKPIDKFLLVCGLSSLKARHISLKKAGVFSTVRHPKISNREKAIVTSLNLCNVWPDNIVPHGNTKSLFTTEGIGCDEPLKREKLWINSSGEMFFSLLTVFFDSTSTCLYIDSEGIKALECNYIYYDTKDN